MPTEPSPYVSRGGSKLAAALRHFDLDITGWVCADLGCNVGGFTDCLLQAGAKQVFSVDTGYGTLAWKLRNDPRVTVLERQNALYLQPTTLPAWQATGGCDLVVIDLGWTRQQHALPAALRWLRPGLQPAQAAAPPAGMPISTSPTTSAGQTQVAAPASDRQGHIISLIKPHYEADKQAHRRGVQGVLTETDAAAVMERVLAELPALGVQVCGQMVSPLRGGASRGRTGNIEYLAWLQPA